MYQARLENVTRKPNIMYLLIYINKNTNLEQVWPGFQRAGALSSCGAGPHGVTEQCPAQRVARSVQSSRLKMHIWELQAGAGMFCLCSCMHTDTHMHHTCIHVQGAESVLAQAERDPEDQTSKVYRDNFSVVESEVIFIFFLRHFYIL